MLNPAILSLSATSIPVVFEAEAVTAFAAMSVQPDSTRKTYYNNYIKALKNAGVWAKLDVISLYAAHDAQAALLNLKNPGTFDATLVDPTTDVTFTVDRGFTTNGTDNYVDTNFNPSTAGGAFTQNAACFGIRCLSTGQFSVTPCGWFDGTDGVSLNPRNTSDDPQFRINQASASAQSTTLSTAAAFLLANRSASNATQLYRNGAAVTVNTNPNQTSTALNNNNLYIGRLSAAGFAAIQCASTYLGGSLDATENSALYTADLTYMQAVGAV